MNDLYFIAFTYFGKFRTGTTYHVARKKGRGYVSACGINTMFAVNPEPDFCEFFEPTMGLELCPMCNKNWNRATGEFKRPRGKQVTREVAFDTSEGEFTLRS